MGILRDELEAIYREQGELTPALLVDVARAPGHPLHPRFEWDDTVAGEKFRRHQARQLIRSVRIRVIDEDDPGNNYDIRAYQAVRSSTGHHSYESTMKVAEDPFMSRLVLANMEREWRTLKERYENWHEFWVLVNQDVQVRSEGAHTAVEKYGAYIA